MKTNIESDKELKARMNSVDTFVLNFEKNDIVRSRTYEAFSC